MRYAARLLCIFMVLGTAAAAQDTPLRPAELTTVRPADQIEARSFYGRVRALKTVDLAFQVGGQIEEFPIVEGARIVIGDLVGQLDLTPLRQSLERAEVNLAKAERDLERLQTLSSSAVAEVQVRDAETTRDLARIDVTEAQRQLDEATLHAPFDALVARRMAVRYATVAAGEPVARLHDMSELRVDIDVPEILFARAAGTDTSQIQFHAEFVGHPDEYPLTLREFEAETGDVSQTYSLTLGLDEEVPETILPGASATVFARANLPDSGASLAIPETALVFEADRSPSVMVFTPDEDGGQTGTVARTPVEIEMRPDANVVVTEGLATGDVIVSAGASLLEDGQRVRRFEGLGE
ncbi:efflux RND transporter periplasmic adaptor subunit [uncultured Jannaschia sp.]|uniref:efflux RND transporter periplasmic adaptor subunit n=1 Tax=uncultured Jannaschia sp. TaxID=293347 RepID=UPI002633CF6D|nr:efflux RND transporter periplasmic adaptor subunit [uncultured Jannaschia sp.]